MSKLIRGTHHVALKCAGTAEFQKTVSFYTEVLDLEPVRSWGSGTDSGIMLSTGNSLIEIFANGEDRPGEGAIRHFALATDDVDACADAVRKAGYPITVEPKDGVIASNPSFPIRIAFCIGPVGETIEFFKER